MRLQLPVLTFLLVMLHGACADLTIPECDILWGQAKTANNRWFKTYENTQAKICPMFIGNCLITGSNSNGKVSNHLDFFYSGQALFVRSMSLVTVDEYCAEHRAAAEKEEAEKEARKPKIAEPIKPIRIDKLLSNHRENIDTNKPTQAIVNAQKDSPSSTSQDMPINKETEITKSAIEVSGTPESPIKENIDSHGKDAVRGTSDASVVKPATYIKESTIDGVQHSPAKGAQDNTKKTNLDNPAKDKLESTIMAGVENGQKDVPVSNKEVGVLNGGHAIPEGASEVSLQKEGDAAPEIASEISLHIGEQAISQNAGEGIQKGGDSIPDTASEVGLNDGGKVIPESTAEVSQNDGGQAVPESTAEANAQDGGHAVPERIAEISLHNQEHHAIDTESKPSLDSIATDMQVSTKEDDQDVMPKDTAGNKQGEGSSDSTGMVSLEKLDHDISESAGKDSLENQEERNLEKQEPHFTGSNSKESLDNQEPHFTVSTSKGSLENQWPHFTVSTSKDSLENKVQHSTLSNVESIHEDGQWNTAKISTGSTHKVPPAAQSSQVEDHAVDREEEERKREQQKIKDALNERCNNLWKSANTAYSGFWANEQDAWKSVCEMRKIKCVVSDTRTNGWRRYHMTIFYKEDMLMIKTTEDTTVEAKCLIFFPKEEEQEVKQDGHEDVTTQDELVNSEEMERCSEIWGKAKMCNSPWYEGSDDVWSLVCNMREMKVCKLKEKVSDGYVHRHVNLEFSGEKLSVKLTSNLPLSEWCEYYVTAPTEEKESHQEEPEHVAEDAKHVQEDKQDSHQVSTDHGRDSKDDSYHHVNDKDTQERLDEKRLADKAIVSIKEDASNVKRCKELWKRVKVVNHQKDKKPLELFGYICGMVKEECGMKDSQELISDNNFIMLYFNMEAESIPIKTTTPLEERCKDVTKDWDHVEPEKKMVTMFKAYATSEKAQQIIKVFDTLQESLTKMVGKLKEENKVIEHFVALKENVMSWIGNPEKTEKITEAFNNFKEFLLRSLKG